MIDVALSPEAAALREQLRNGGMLPASAPGETVDPLRNGHRVLDKSGAASRKKNPLAAARFGELNAFIDITMAGLTRAEVTTWFAMFRYVDSKKQTVSVSVRTIAERTGTSFQHVHKAIASLIDKGLLERLKTGGINSGSSVYRLRPTVHP